MIVCSQNGWTDSVIGQHRGTDQGVVVVAVNFDDSDIWFNRCGQWSFLISFLCGWSIKTCGWCPMTSIVCSLVFNSFLLHLSHRIALAFHVEPEITVCFSSLFSSCPNSHLISLLSGSTLSFIFERVCSLQQHGLPLEYRGLISILLPTDAPKSTASAPHFGAVDGFHGMVHSSYYAQYAGSSISAESILRQ